MHEPSGWLGDSDFFLILAYPKQKLVWLHKILASSLAPLSTLSLVILGKRHN